VDVDGDAQMVPADAVERVVDDGGSVDPEVEVEVGKGSGEGGTGQGDQVDNRAGGEVREGKGVMKTINDDEEEDEEEEDDDDPKPKGKRRSRRLKVTANKAAPTTPKERKPKPKPKVSSEDYVIDGRVANFIDVTEVTVSEVSCLLI